MSESCLRTKDGQNVPLKKVRIQGELLGATGRIQVLQTYVNGESKAVEAVYVFPISSAATLIGFVMTCNGRRLSAQIKKREEAFHAYDEAISKGHGAALLDQERANVFTASVGNLLPGEETVIEVEYVRLVELEEGVLRWIIPSLVAPRYIPGTATGSRTAFGTADPTDQVPDADRITPPTGPANYSLELDLRVAVGDGVSVECASHGIVTRMETDGGCRIAFAAQDVALDRDLVIQLKTAPDRERGVWTQLLSHLAAGQPGCFALTLLPDLTSLPTTSTHQQVVFVLDTSGSMRGTSLSQAKTALRLSLRQLREGAEFNVIEFNSTWSSFRPRLVTFDQESLNAIDQWIEPLAAHGGTELAAPLLAAVEQAPEGAVVLLTDGQVGNEDAILSSVLSARRSCRIYSFGIGTNISDALLLELAKTSGGGLEMIHPGERIDERVIAQFSRVVAARVSNLKMTVDGMDIHSVTPAELPSLIDGQPWTVYFRADRPSLVRITLQGTFEGGPWALTKEVDFQKASSNPHLTKLWAARLIEEYQLAKLEGRRADAMEQRIVSLSLEHGIATRWTSFVVIEERFGERRADGIPETRVVPVHAPAGWEMLASHPLWREPHGIFSGRPHFRHPMALNSSGPRDMTGASGGRINHNISKTKESLGDAAGGVRSVVGGVQRMMLTNEGVTRTPLADPVADLFARQLASGMWNGTSADGNSSCDKVQATVEALEFNQSRSISTSHPLYGIQVKKAVEALLELIHTDKVLEPMRDRALKAALGCASNDRLRDRIRAVANALTITLS